MATLNCAHTVTDALPCRPVFQNGKTTNDDWLLLFRQQPSSSTSSSASSSNATTTTTTGSVVMVAWTTASFGHVARIPGGEGCWRVGNWLGNVARDPICHDPRGLHVMLSDSPQYLTLQQFT